MPRRAQMQLIRRKILRLDRPILIRRSRKKITEKRPLPPRLLDYAVNDTRFLPFIVQKLREELAALGRIEWHRQQCAQLIQSTSMPRERNLEEVWRIKGSSALDRENLAILRELWKWRDDEARRWDRPAFMVCRNEQLLEWSVWGKKTKDEGVAQASSLRKTGKMAGKDACAASSFLLPPKLPPRWPPHRVKSLEQAFLRAWKLPSSEWPDHPPRGKRPPYNPEFNARMDRLRAVRDARARELNLDPSLLASNAMLAAIASRNPKRLEDFMEIEKWLLWQTEILGRPFLEALNQNPR